VFLQLDKISAYYQVMGSGIPVFNIHGFWPDHRLMKGATEPVFRNQNFKRVYLGEMG
jgi:hypothetical protein